MERQSRIGGSRIQLTVPKTTTIFPAWKVARMNPMRRGRAGRQVVLLALPGPFSGVDEIHRLAWRKRPRIHHLGGMASFKGVGGEG